MKPTPGLKMSKIRIELLKSQVNMEHRMIRVDPVVIVGMHRSGTSYLSRILESSGVFMGIHKESNNESVPFLKFNDKILKKQGLKWYSLRNNITHNIKGDFFTASKLLELQHNHGINDKTVAWGWKDPRTTIFLNEYCEIMPESKFIHIYRNPFDVIQSLRKRQESINNLSYIRKFVLRLSAYLRYGTLINSSDMILSWDHSFELWKKYTQKAFDFNGNILHIKYEDLILDTSKKIEEISQFLRLEINISKEGDKDKVYQAYKKIDLIDIIKSFSEDELVQKLGYAYSHVALSLDD